MNHRFDHDSTSGWRSSPLSTQRRQVRQMLFLAFGLGIALTAIALLLIKASPSTGSRIVAGVAGAVAGALIGATVSNVVNAQYDRPVLDEIQDLLLRTSRCAVTSPEAQLVGMRRVWHHYHRTAIQGKAVWRYARYPFDNHGAVGALTADVPVVDTVGAREPHLYKTDGAVWDRRLVILQTRIEGDEAAVVELFPDISGFQQVHAGVAIMQSWSGNDVLTPALLSLSPLLSEQAEGSVMDPEFAETLDRLWSDNFARVKRLLPERPDPGLA